MQKILIVGATSAIAEATARLWAERGDALFLVGRKPERLEAIAADLRVRGASCVECLPLDACAVDSHAAMLDATKVALGGLDIALIAHGSLPDQKACEASVETTLKEIEINGLSVVALATRLGNLFEAQGSGSLAVISSVAGDRGRQSNYVYGAAKGMVSLFLQGLRNRLAKRGGASAHNQARICRYPDDGGFSERPSMGEAGGGCERYRCSYRKKRDEVYLPLFWWPIMSVIKHIPERVFKRLSL